MVIDEIKERFVSWEKLLTARQKTNIHFYSMRNFAHHFNDLPNEYVKSQVVQVLQDYVIEVEENNFYYGGISSYDLVTRYMNKISDTYAMYLGFRSFIRFHFVLIFSILGDGFLYLIFYNRFQFYFPVVFVVLLIYYLYTKYFFERRKMVFGIFY